MGEAIPAKQRRGSTTKTAVSVIVTDNEDEDDNRSLGKLSDTKSRVDGAVQGSSVGSRDDNLQHQMSKPTLPNTAPAQTHSKTLPNAKPGQTMGPTRTKRDTQRTQRSVQTPLAGTAPGTYS